MFHSIVKFQVSEANPPVKREEKLKPDGGLRRIKFTPQQKQIMDEVRRKNPSKSDAQLAKSISDQLMIPEASVRTHFKNVKAAEKRVQDAE